MTETKYVELNKIPTTMFIPTKEYSPTIRITEWEYRQLCKKFGSYGFSWYFTETNSIKYFDGEWHYGKIKEILNGF